MKRLQTHLFSVIAVLASTAAFATDQPKHVWSYTMEEMYQMAIYFKQIGHAQKVDDILEAGLKAAEFRGYIAALLDDSNNQNPKVTECARKYSVNEIAMRTAIVLTSNPLDRSALSVIAVRVALQFACDESTWKKTR